MWTHEHTPHPTPQPPVPQGAPGPAARAGRAAGGGADALPAPPRRGPAQHAPHAPPALLPVRLHVPRRAGPRQVRACVEGGGGRLGWGVVCWLDGCIVGLQRLILFNYYPTHPTPPPPTNNQHSLRETLTRIGKRYFRGASTDAAAGPAGKSARARQSQALVDTFRAAFERDFRTSTASGPEEKEQQQQQEQQPLSIQEVRWKGGIGGYVVAWCPIACSLGFLLMLTPNPQKQPALQTKPRTHRSSWC